MPVRIVSDAEIAKEQNVTVEVLKPDNVIEEKTDSWVVEKKELEPFENEADSDGYDPPPENPKAKLFPDNIPLWVWVGIGLLIVGGIGGIIYFTFFKNNKTKK